MKVEEIVSRINTHRTKLNLSPVNINQRPSRSAPGKTTIEILSNQLVLAKSISWGPIAAFLKGMLQVFSEKPITEKFETPIQHKRKIDWR